MKKERILLDDVKLCNCCVCDCPMLGESMAKLDTQVENVRKLLPIGVRDLPFVGRRINGRPWCISCYHKKRLREVETRRLNNRASS